ncbi:MAG: hypothetical protein Q8L98_04510 [Chlamydiales bacterium]|nr:hypothetical protein [Chlamydiales bacterium]
MPIKIGPSLFLPPVKTEESTPSEEEGQLVQAQLITRSGVRIVTLEEND